MGCKLGCRDTLYLPRIPRRPLLVTASHSALHAASVNQRNTRHLVNESCHQVCQCRVARRAKANEHHGLQDLRIRPQESVGSQARPLQSAGSQTRPQRSAGSQTRAQQSAGSQRRSEDPRDLNGFCQVCKSDDKATGCAGSADWMANSEISRDAARCKLLERFRRTAIEGGRLNGMPCILPARPD